jgi:hypothetical protein
MFCNTPQQVPAFNLHSVICPNFNISPCCHIRVHHFIFVTVRWVKTWKEMHSFFNRCTIDRLCSQCYTISDGCTTKLVHGMLYNFLSNELHWSSNTAVNYALQAVKRQQWLHKQNQCQHKKSELLPVQEKNENFSIEVFLIWVQGGKKKINWPGWVSSIALVQYSVMASFVYKEFCNKIGTQNGICSDIFCSGYQGKECCM